MYNCELLHSFVMPKQKQSIHSLKFPAKSLNFPGSHLRRDELGGDTSRMVSIGANVDPLPFIASQL